MRRATTLELSLTRSHIRLAQSVPRLAQPKHKRASGHSIPRAARPSRSMGCRQGSRIGSGVPSDNIYESNQRGIIFADMSSDACPIWFGIAMVTLGTLVGYAIALITAVLHH